MDVPQRPRTAWTAIFPAECSIHGAPGAEEGCDLAAVGVPTPVDVKVAKLPLRHPHGCFYTQQKEDEKTDSRTFVAFKCIGRIESASRDSKPKKHGRGKRMEGPNAKANQNEAEKQTRSNKNVIKSTYEKDRPDSFLAVQLSQHHAVVDAVRKVQASLTKQNAEMQRVCVAPAKVHITLGVMRLDAPEKLEKAERILQGLREKLATNSPFSITLEGLSTFRNEVLFLDVAKNNGKETLIDLAECVQNEFSKEGLMVLEKRPFNPHATIAKMSKVPPFKRKKLLGTNKFPAETYEEHLDVSAGGVQVSAIQLCSMKLPADSSGYYHVHSVFELCDQ